MTIYLVTDAVDMIWFARLMARKCRSLTANWVISTHH